MKIVTEGVSRLVFVFSDFVVKIPWLNIVKLVISALKHRRNGTLPDKFLRYRSDSQSTLLLVLMLPFRILASNRLEYLFYQKHRHDKCLMPTKGLLWGYIIIQPRGEVLSGRMRRWKRICRRIKSLGIKQGDLINPRNFSLLSGEVVLHDFGNIQSQDVMSGLGIDRLRDLLSS
jgi:hypothetical protein